MFVDFNEAFKNKPVSETRVPDIVIQKLCEELPTGIRYIAGENGDMIMVSESEHMSIGGLTVIIPESFKDVLPDKYTQNDIIQLSYNSQTPIEMKLTHDGFITVNGKEMPIDHIYYNIFHETRIVDNKVMAYPLHFPDPIEIPVSTENGRYVRNLKMSREPYLSLDKVIFKSDDEQPFQLRIISAADSPVWTINVKLELKFASTIRDMVESIFIFNDFADGKAKLGGKLLSHEIPKGNIKKFDVNSAVFWEKVLLLEEFLGVHFMAPESDTDFQTVCDVEWLYRNLICEFPIKQEQSLTSVTGKYTFCDNEVAEKSKEGKLYFQYKTMFDVELFGVNLRLPALCGQFNAAIKDIEKQKNGDVKIELMDISPDSPSYTAVLCFKDVERLQKFIEKTGENISDVLDKAKLVSDYLK